MPELRAHAKLTLSLAITGVRNDGYHEIDAVMVAMSEPHDVVRVERAESTSLTVEGPFAAGVPTDASNVAWRAAAACNATVALHIVKNVPHGAGLGGGSADAAAVLLALGADPTVGATIGADVPFCMWGRAARVTGIGDRIEPAEVAPGWIVIATPQFRCATADVYHAWDELGGPSSPPNDLELAAHRVEPRLIAFKDAVQRATGVDAFLAGSGSSYWVRFDDHEAAEDARVRVARATASSTWLGEPV
jgi:4-diphosphocytidyl-2-C-methyl-D-erythritol kinase